MLTLWQLQGEQREWSARNFPDGAPWHPLLGIVEEVGELSHAYLKAAQGIRGTSDEHRAATADAVGDIVVYLSDFCSRNGYDFEKCVSDTWERVKQRDWKRDPKGGGDAVSPTVYYSGSDLTEPEAVECEALPSADRYPQRDAKNRTMFENTHFANLDDAWRHLLEDAEAGLSLSAVEVRRLRGVLAAAEALLVTDALRLDSVRKGHRRHAQEAKP